MTKSKEAFTLAELIVSIAVLTLLVLLFSRALNSAISVTTPSTKRIDTASEIRPLFNRISVDLSQMVRRTDVSYYVKTSSNAEPGNDLIAFFSLVDGFYPNTGVNAEVKQPQTTLISYRVNAQFQAERMAKSLPFAGQTYSGQTPSSLIFRNSLTPPSTGDTIAKRWPTAVSATGTDSDFGIVAADVFRFEYYYILKSTGQVSTGTWSSADDPAGMRDVAAVVVAVAVIDPKSKKLLTANDVNTLSASMVDYDPATMGTSGLVASWQDTLAASSLPRPALAGVRIYQRFFPL